MIFKLQKSTRLALYVGMELARSFGAEPISVAAVAKRYRVSAPNLAKVFQRLVHVGLANGTRGVGGGYRLTRSPAEVTMLDVIEAFELPTNPEQCLLAADEGDCAELALCQLGRVFSEVDDVLRSTFASISLDTLARPRSLGTVPEPSS